MDGRSSPYAFSLAFPHGRALVVFRALPHEHEEIGSRLAEVLCEELHQAAVRPQRWVEPVPSTLEGRLPPIRLVDLDTQRRRMVRQVLMSDTPRGRCPVGLIHELGFWVMFPCETIDAAERLVDRLSP